MTVEINFGDDYFKFRHLVNVKFCKIEINFGDDYFKFRHLVNVKFCKNDFFFLFSLLKK